MKNSNPNNNIFFPDDSMNLIKISDPLSLTERSKTTEHGQRFSGQIKTNENNQNFMKKEENQS